MAKAYSMDLRERVLKDCDAGRPPSRGAAPARIRKTRTETFEPITEDHGVLARACLR